MPENSPTCARAYVASPVTAESGVFLAIRWAFTLDHALGWSSIGIIAPDPDGEHRLSHLYRMRSRGIRIGTINQALTTRTFSGVMIAYRPDPLALARTQDILGAIGVVALAADRGGLQPWVDAYHPQHLGGEEITPTPDPPQAGLLERILASYTTRFTSRTGPLPPADRQILAEAIHQLRHHGHLHPRRRCWPSLCGSGGQGRPPGTCTAWPSGGTPQRRLALRPRHQCRPHRGQTSTPAAEPRTAPLTPR